MKLLIYMILMGFSSKKIFFSCLTTSLLACSFSCKKTCERHYTLKGEANIWNNISNSDTIHFNLSSDGYMEDTEIGGTFRVKNFPLQNILTAKKVTSPKQNMSEQSLVDINSFFDLYLKKGILLENTIGLLTQFNTSECDLQLEYDLIALESGTFVFNTFMEYHSNHKDYPSIDLEETDCEQKLRGTFYDINQGNALDNHFNLLQSMVDIDESIYKYGYYTVTVLP